MRALIQRAKRASVSVEGELIAHIDRGLLVLLGVARTDTKEDARRLAKKCWELRVFPAEGTASERANMDRPVSEVGGSVLVVSQFTLYADTSRGRRPSFAEAAPTRQAEALYLLFCKALEDLGAAVATGRFGAMMDVEVVNEGPVTILLES
ncbi:MAG: D-tyrosyl-tRNA(Tyr) deacylase [Acidimicrobiia bacterium]